jgi:hypothetical protein
MDMWVLIPPPRLIGLISPLANPDTLILPDNLSILTIGVQIQDFAVPHKSYFTNRIIPDSLTFSVER